MDVRIILLRYNLDHKITVKQSMTHHPDSTPGLCVTRTITNRRVKGHYYRCLIYRNLADTSRKTKMYREGAM